MALIGSGQLDNLDANVVDLLKNLNLTTEEEKVMAFSDNEADESSPTVEWALVGKVLSPMTVDASAIQGVMKPTWGNLVGMKIRTILGKGG
jgi:hypothetical protein